MEKAKDNSEKPLISIIVPVYNVRPYLCECLDSILRQTYKNIQVVTVDDGSTDGSGDILDEYAKKDSRITLIRQKNSGIAAARNAGLDASKGEYIGFVDSDDSISPDMYEYLYGLISSTNASIAMCNYSGRISSLQPIDKEGLLSDSYDIFAYKGFVFLWNKLIRRSVIDGLRFNTSASISEDTFFMFDILKKKIPVAVGKEEKYNYRKRNGSASLTFNPSYLKKLPIEEQYINQAKELGIDAFVKTRIANNAYRIMQWLRLITEQESPDIASAEYLVDFLRSHWRWFFLNPRLSIKKKIYAALYCINFSLARKIYRMRRGKK